MFVSISDMEKTATVFHATGATMGEAWDHALDASKEAVASKELEPAWVRVDLVTEAGEVTDGQLADMLKNMPYGYWRKGLAIGYGDKPFDEGGPAFLE